MRIGTRGSPLALAQASWVAERIPGGELVTITTAGDRGAQADKSRWTSELERALLEGEVDLAVHSAKDVPSELAEGLAIVAVPPREDPRDVLVGASSLRDLAPMARVGTSSLRREAQLRGRDVPVDVVPVRGNVDTRLRKLAEGQCDALVLAWAGLARLGRAEVIGGVLDEMTPAPGQGALIIEARSELAGDPRLAVLRDPVAEIELTVERELVSLLGAGCDTPLGIRARAREGQVALRSWLGRPDGSAWIADEVHGEPAGLAARAAERLRAVGAEELLA